MINVTQTYLPDEKAYFGFLKRAFKNRWLTNRGELVLELENKLKEYLQLEYLILTTNGTLPLQIALNKFAKCGEVITTPFSYVATLSSIVWEKCTPVFVDIDQKYLTIDEKKIEEKITKNTTAILATHVYGNPCNVIEIEKIALKHNLFVIYDSAHCFGVEYLGKSIFSYGDISTSSLHATKIFHTGEGGILFSKNKNIHDIAFYSHNFGHNGPNEFHGLGINAKMSELQAALGLAILPDFDKILDYRKNIVAYYDNKLNFKLFNRINIREGVKWNYSYYPLVFETPQLLESAIMILNHNNIFPRRYFMPSLNKLSYVKYTSMPKSESVSERIMCIPLFYGLDFKDLDRIIELLNNL